MSDTPPTDKRVVALLNLEYPGRPAGQASGEADNKSTSLIKEMYHVYAGSTLRVGRAKTNDIVLNDRDVSRFHATFSASENGVVLCDLASTNGTFIGGRRITAPIDLESNTAVTMGNVKIFVQLHYSEDVSQYDGTQTALSDLKAVEVTVLLVDIVSYTRISQELPADAVAKMLRAWFEIVGPIIERHGGEIDKYIGDCVMAIWRGTTKNASPSAVSAVTAGLEIIEATKNMSESENWPFRDRHPWRCRAGLNSGTALFGSVGAGDRRNYTVLGDAINVAFRIESLAGKLGKDLLMSEHTAELVKSVFYVEPVGQHDLEGRIGEMSLFTTSALAKK